MDPYVQLKINTDIYKTQISKDGGKNPKWTDTIELKTCNPTDIMEIKVKDECVGSDDDVGKCQIKLSQLMYGKGVNESFILLWKNKKAGEVIVQSIYNDGKVPEQPKPVQ
jgi:hypothetical protein